MTEGDLDGPTAGRVAAGIANLDPIFEHRLRLGACVLLSRADAIRFAQLKRLLDATDGNLGAQMRKLEEAGYVEGTKEFDNRKPVTWYALTPQGRTALHRHLSAYAQLTRI